MRNVDLDDVIDEAVITSINHPKCRKSNTPDVILSCGW